jgi:hypothetical protein
LLAIINSEFHITSRVMLIKNLQRNLCENE